MGAAETRADQRDSADPREAVSGRNPEPAGKSPAVLCGGAGEVKPEQLAAALVSMKVRGEQPQEIAGAATALLENAAPFPRPDYLFADIVGTGGDGSNSINISTASAFVAAACGLKVAKHGNRAYRASRALPICWPRSVSTGYECRQVPHRAG